MKKAAAYRLKAEGGTVRDDVGRRIVAEARRHFFSHGFRTITMDDLAAELGMSKKTVYAHFPSKIALVEGAILSKLSEIEEDLDRITAAHFHASDFLDKLQHLLACMQRHTEEIRPPFIRDIRRDAPEIFSLVEDRRRDLIERYFGKLFHEGRNAGIIRRDIPVTLIIAILLGATEAIMNPRRIAELGLTPEAGFSAIVKVIFEGVISGKRRLKP